MVVIGYSPARWACVSVCVCVHRCRYCKVFVKGADGHSYSEISQLENLSR